MAVTRRIVKIFLASPGDLNEERRIVKAVVDEYNVTFADFFGVHVELIGWEDTVSVYGRPQATINRDLDRCEFFIGMLWRRWGTPPDNEGKFSSGFEEEFERSITKRRVDGRPELSLFFKKVDDDILKDPGDDLKKVLFFKDQIIANKEILFEEFLDAAEFEAKVRRRINAYVLELKGVESQGLGEEGDASPEPTPPQSVLTSTNLFSPEGMGFLRELIDGDKRGAEVDVTSVEAARFRLLASIMKRQGNDEITIGVHDANILFAARSKINLGKREFVGLIDAGLSGITQQNIPLWHWVNRSGSLADGTLSVHSLFGASEKRVGALNALRLIGEPLFVKEGGVDRGTYFSSWFEKDNAADVKKEALSYLADCGLMADLPAIKEEFERSDYQTAQAASEAIIRINLRNGREDALLALYELQPETVSQAVLDKVFEHPAAIENDVLTQGIAHRCPAVRRAAARLLRERKMLPADMAEQLTSDSDAEVRLEAVYALLHSGKSLSDAEVKTILVKPRQGFFGGLPSDHHGEECWRRYRLQGLAKMPKQELQSAAESAQIYDFDARLVLAEREFAAHGQWLRSAVEDHFRSEFSAAMLKIELLYGAANAKEWKGLEDHLIKKLTRQALDIICAKGYREDLPLVRRALECGYIDGSELDIKYLGKYGEWRDISLIISVVKSGAAGYGASGGLLTIRAENNEVYSIGARALYAIGRERLDDLLGLDMPWQMLERLIALIPDKAFRNISTDKISLFLSSELESVRKAATLKCLCALNRSKNEKILAEYLALDYRYYNVIHWLDFGISIQKERVRPTALKLLLVD